MSFIVLCLLLYVPVSFVDVMYSKHDFSAAAAGQCENLAILGGAIASGAETANPPNNAIDNNLASRWSNQGVGSWITVDLGSQKTLCSVEIAWHNGDERRNDFTMSTSLDGSNFANIYTGVSSGITDAPERYTPSKEVNTRYLKVTVNGNTVNDWASITEIDILGFTTTSAPQAASPDTIQPTVAIRSHSNGQTVTVSNTPATLTISGTSFDSASGIQKVEVRTGTTSYQLATPKAPGDWSAWTNTRTFATTGTHAIVARATDNAGNQQWHEISVTVVKGTTTPPVQDTVKPAVAITYPKSGAGFADPSGSTGSSSKITISGTSFDSASGIQKVEVRTGTTSYQLATPKAPGDWSAWTNTRTFATTGTHAIVARATDNAGNQQWHEINIVIGSLDKFSVKKLYETETGGREWFAKWDSNPRTLGWGWDPYDSEFDIHGNIKYLKVNGDGTATVSGDNPRFYIHDKGEEKTWQNVEITYYAKRISESQNVSYQAFTAGTRVDSPSSGDDCDGFGYYGMLRFNGRLVFQKELINHVAYSTVEPYPWITPWANDGPFPKNQWIGIKYIVRNMDGGDSVKMEVYRDMTNGLNGGTWEKIGEYVDSGNWFASGEPWGSNNYTWIDCGDGRTKNWVITDPYPAVLLRTDYISAADYKKFSVREINPLP